jgi:hypothetical protein
MNAIIINIGDQHWLWNEYKYGYQPNSNFLVVQNGDLLEDSCNILREYKKRSKSLNVQCQWR